ASEQGGLADDALKRITSPLTAATDGRRKLLRLGTEERLYDLEADPLEASPIADANGDPGIAALREALRRPLAWTAGTPAPVAETADDLGDIERQMKLLGSL